MPLTIKRNPPPTTTTLTRPTPTNPNPPTNPPLLTHALTIRNKVFVDEQGCSPENEIDDDDARSWHWVAFASPEMVGRGRGAEAGVGDGADAIGTIRLVPPPHAPHGHGQDQNQDQGHEPYIKLTRVAVLREHRGKGIGRDLVEAALAWARSHPDEINNALGRVSGLTALGPGDGWRGLVLVHAQIDVEGMYARLGFEVDEGMGRWLEEGIEHVGMWRRVQML